jgi:primosomal protein N' (replication factor Y)
MPGLFDEPSVSHVQVAVERGVDRFPDGLSYGVPASMELLKIGDRVTVPLGRGNTPTPGWVIDVLDDPPDVPGGGEPKQVLDRDRSAVALPKNLVELARWISRYYAAPIGPTLATMLPGAVRLGTGLAKRQRVDLAISLPDLPDNVRITPTQQRVIDAVADLPQTRRPVAIPQLKKAAGIGSRGPIDRLIDHGILISRRVSSIEASWFDQAVDRRPPPTLTAEQETVVNSIAPAIGEGFSCHLLQGVTGSGKTEVYMRLIERSLQDGGTAIVLVPEIALTPQTGARLIGRFPDKRVAILHSSLTAAQRHQQWAMVARGDADIVLGARSAAFAPIPDGELRLIIVDEEHDASYKQDSAPRYHGRDVAIRRASMSACPVVLGSATPSLESWANAKRFGRSTLHTLSRRAPGLVAPSIEIVDMRGARSMEGGGPPIFSRHLDDAIRNVLKDNGQIVLLLNRRGFAPYLVCASRTCGWTLRCADCDATMVYHRRRVTSDAGFVRCHHCGTECRVPKSCPDCGQAVVRLGVGTQRLEDFVRQQLPIDADRIARLDADTTRRAADLHAAIDRFARGEIQVLLGTQMIAKGLDIPGVRLVGVIDADTSIDLPDFRAAERTCQLVSQVCGRCGRSEGEARAVIQTWNPDAPPIRMAAEGLYTTFADRELGLRAASGLPPETRMLRLVSRDGEAAVARGRAESIAARLRGIAGMEVTVAPPVPCVLPRIAERFRYEVVLSAATVGPLQALLAEARAAGILRSGRDLVIDVDPVSML